MTGVDDDAFAASRAGFEGLASWLGGAEADALEHGELERRIDDDGRKVLCQLFQDHLDLRADRERRADVVDADGDAHTRVGAGHERGLATVFGEVTVRRLAYRRPGHANLHPADGALNLPAERHSHGLRRLAAVESSRGSFDEAAQAVERATGTRVGRRQVEQLAARAAADVDSFYEAVEREGAEDDDVLVISADGKGIVMRPWGCARPPPRPRPRPWPSWRPACPRARRPTASAWPPSAPSMTSPPSPEARRASSPQGGTRTPPTPAPVAKNKWRRRAVDLKPPRRLARQPNASQREVRFQEVSERSEVGIYRIKKFFERLRGRSS